MTHMQACEHSYMHACLERMRLHSVDGSTKAQLPQWQQICQSIQYPSFGGDVLGHNFRDRNVPAAASLISVRCVLDAAFQDDFQDKICQRCTAIRDQEHLRGAASTLTFFIADVLHRIVSSSSVSSCLGSVLQLCSAPDASSSSSHATDLSCS